MKIRAITKLAEDVAGLIEQSRRYQKALYPPESINQDDPEDLVAGGMYFIGAYDSEKLCGVGGVKIIDGDCTYGEIKNLFVDPNCRGLGVSKKIMSALEQYLRDAGIKLCRLETGVSQPESISLYHKLGYQDRAAYGSYAPDPLCVFMQKVIE